MDTKKLRQKILDLAIRGKLVPQDPNDEPASVLLERIRAEKERLIKEGKIKRSKKTTSDTPHYENDVPFEVPDGWISCRFDRICSKFSTGPFGSMVHKADYVSDGGVPIVNPMNIVAGDILNDNLMMVSNEKAQELNRYRLSVDDILIARRGDLKKCAIVKETAVDWLCGTGSFFLHVPYVESRYIQLFYLSEYVQTILSKECVGATMDNLNQSVLGAIPFLLPPQKEQRRIISEVDKWFALIDTLETEKEDLQTFIAQTKSKILDLAIHGKLVPQDQNDEPAIELLKRINPKFTPCDNAHYENNTIEIPENWEWVKLSDIAVSELGKTLDKGKNSGTPHNYLCAFNVKWCSFDLFVIKKILLEKEELERYKVRKGDLLICEGGDVGRAAIWESDQDIYYQNALHRVRFKDEINQYFYLYVLQYYKSLGMIDDVSGGVTIKHFTQNSMKKLSFPLPPIKEQQRIVSAINQYNTILDNISANL